jgi:hypothetical protein
MNKYIMILPILGLMGCNIPSPIDSHIEVEYKQERIELCTDLCGAGVLTGFLVIKSRVNNLSVMGLSVNEGTCPVFGFEQTALNMGQKMAVQLGDCEPVKVQINTNEGEQEFTFE